MALKQSSFGRVLLFVLVLMAQPAPAQISAWKLGGAGSVVERKRHHASVHRLRQRARLHPAHLPDA